MFLSDDIPILINLPSSKEYVDVYFIHDIHYGSELFNERKWREIKEMILGDENAVVCFVGDMMENAIPNSKSDMFTQAQTPAVQKEWVTEQLKDLSHKIIVVLLLS